MRLMCNLNMVGYHICIVVLLCAFMTMVKEIVLIVANTSTKI